MRRRKTVFVDADILVVGGGMGGCGATYESRYWGRDLKIVCVEKANIERSGAVAQGLYAINCYMGMHWNENQPEDHVRYVRNDLMGLVREDLGYDIARHVDATVHKFEEWGLPIMRDPETGRYQREGKWQIMIHGESYKPIVAEAARKAASDWNQALMELGETICTPQSPRCAACPISRWCEAHAQGLANEIPAPRRKRVAVNIKIAAAILCDPQGHTLLVKEPGAHDHVLFSRMWQFPAVEVKRNARSELTNHLRTTLGMNGITLTALPEARHGVTFRNVTLLPFLARVDQLPANAGTQVRVLPLKSIARIPISSATRKIANAATSVQISQQPISRLAAVQSAVRNQPPPQC